MSQDSVGDGQTASAHLRKPGRAGDRPGARQRWGFAAVEEGSRVGERGALTSGSDGLPWLRWTPGDPAQGASVSSIVCPRVAGDPCHSYLGASEDPQRPSGTTAPPWWTSWSDLGVSAEVFVPPCGGKPPGVPGLYTPVTLGPSSDLVPPAGPRPGQGERLPLPPLSACLPLQTPSAPRPQGITAVSPGLLASPVRLLGTLPRPPRLCPSAAEGGTGIGLPESTLNN